MINRFNLFARNLKQVLITIDQFLRCVLGLVLGLINGHSKAYADETLSAYIYRKSLNHNYANILRMIVDAVMYPFEGFQWGHCQDSYLSEFKKKHLPPEYCIEPDNLKGDNTSV